MPIEDRINQLVGDFVSKIALLAREAAVETLTKGLSANGEAVPARRGRGPSVKAVQTVSTRRPKKGAKRPKADIARLEGVLAKHIEKYPGQRVEQINQVLGTKTNDVRLPLAKLIAAKTVKTKGERRATQYFPA